MNIYTREMRAHRNSLIGWSIGMVILVAAGMAKFASLSSDTQSATELFNTFPKAMTAILGIQGLDLTTVIGYFGVLFLYIVLMATIHAAMIGSEIISKEERDKTSEFLFPKPITRHRAVTEKLLAALTNVVILNIVTTISSVVAVGAFSDNESDYNMVVVLMTGLMITQLIFFAVGAALAGIFKNPKLPAIVSTVVLMMTYIAWVVADLNSALGVLKYLTPFSYFQASSIIDSGHLDNLYVMVSAVIIVVLITTSYISFRQRDLKV